MDWFYRPLGLAFRFGNWCRWATRWLASFGVAMALLVFWVPALAADKALEVLKVMVLEDSRPSVEAWPFVTVFEDDSKAMRIERFLTEPPPFKVPDTAYGVLGLRTDAVWLHIPVSVSAQSNGQWIFDIDYAVLNHINLYVVAEGKVVREAAMGNGASNDVGPGVRHSPKGPRDVRRTRNKSPCNRINGLLRVAAKRRLGLDFLRRRRQSLPSG